MKRLLVAAVSILFVAAAGAAFGDARENSGCGLGTMIFKNNDNSSVVQAFEVTTNGIASNTIAITVGTSECKQPAKFVSNERLNEFVVANMDNLAKDISRGGGETVEAFADLLQVPAEKRSEFYRNLQINFASIFTSENVVLADVVDNTIAVSFQN